ncbi:hypothetical protein P7K49_026107 [Saguinus oedipus]|uniref:Uncharacterized protein n=1 Tax=Saguinus oedipus TaxID=9490 RepID=A0ABQ9UKL4_SAGOE|nr:hypothetical protein P7K49_026107 [Saguinus oedipus]
MGSSPGRAAAPLCPCQWPADVLSGQTVRQGPGASGLALMATPGSELTEQVELPGTPTGHGGTRELSTGLAGVAQALLDVPPTLSS